ncbi:hypothetical protein FQN57_004172 [Myotisia sp. PD_48]|nr:hypothetical protein FQN57_004172 [Myotisia sp. PD_48]
MGGQPALNDLCTICHIDAWKYKCPRCDTRTCSLACSKRHKVWSQCSGIRDPASYLKRKDLNTPAAFDKDFNFITGIERSLERADRDAEHRGIPLPSSSKNGKRRHDPIKGEVALQKGLYNSGVHIVKAPKGISRNVLNGTNWNKKQKCLNWTTEWIFPGGKKVLSRFAESITLDTALSRLPLAKDLHLVNEVPNSRPTKKRRLSNATEPEFKPPGVCPGIPEVVVPDIHEQPTAEIEQSIAETTNEIPKVQRNLSRTVTPEPTPHTEPPSSSLITGSSNDADDTTFSQLDDTNRKAYIYLHRPQTRGATPVLIPISSSSTLADVLRERVVLEFPTFYVLEQPVDELPAGKYILEEQYLLENQSEEDHQNEESNSIVNNENIHEDDKDLSDIDELKVLEVLRRDLENGVDVSF